jgi:glucan phosphoethanolaminetransferase (alkaline phosphatase superfamily)
VSRREPGPSDERSGSLPIVFAALLAATLAACCVAAAWLFEGTARGLVALALQHATVVAVSLLLAALARGAVARGLLLAAAVGYALAIQAHTLTMAAVSLPADALLRLLTSRADAAAVWQQAHVTTRDVLAVLALLAVEVAVFVVLYRRGPRSDRAASRRFLTPVAAALTAAFVAEQALGRHSDEYLRRQAILPGYHRLFAGDIEPFTFTSDRTPEERLDAAVEGVRPARNPKNVILILLESFRYDVVGPELTPHLDALGGRSLLFTNAYAASTTTSRVWNVLLFNRPAHMFARDRAAYEAGGARKGAFPVRVLRRAGYQALVSMGCNFDWHDYRRRFVGEPAVVDLFYSSYPGHNRARHVADDRAVDEIVRWLGDPALPTPFFLLTHLDSTHFYYFFHEDRAVARPYAEAVTTRRLLARSPESRDLLFNRYKNAAAHADFNVGRILQAVDAAALSEDTAIVVLSDHGQSFDLGTVGHLQVSEETKHVPLLMRLPGVPPARDDRLLTDADVFPTLFDYLRVPGLDAGVLLGRSALSGPPRRSVLTLEAAMRQAHLTFPRFTVVFDLDAAEERTLTFSPRTVLGPDGEPMPGWRDMLATVPWRSELSHNLTEGEPAKGSS